MGVIVRSFKEHPVPQGIDENIVYVLDTTPWGGTPTNEAVVVKDEDGEDVSASVLSGTPSVSGDDISTPTVQGSAMTAGKTYRMEIKFTTSGNDLEAWGDIEAET